MGFTIWDVILGVGGIITLFIIVPLLLLAAAGFTLAAVVRGVIHTLTPEKHPRYMWINETYVPVSRPPSPTTGKRFQLAAGAWRGIFRWLIVTGLFGLATSLSLFLNFYVYHHAAMLDGLTYALLANMGSLAIGLAFVRQHILPEDTMPRRGWLAAFIVAILTGWLAAAFAGRSSQPFFSGNCDPLPVNKAIFPAIFSMGAALTAFICGLLVVEWLHMYGQVYKTWRWIPALLVGGIITWAAAAIEFPRLFGLALLLVPMIVVGTEATHNDKLWRQLAGAPVTLLACASLIVVFVYWLSGHIATWQMTPPGHPSASLWFMWGLAGLVPGALGGLALVHVWQMRPHPAYPYRSNKLMMP